MLQCGLCEERFLSNDDLKEHLEGHASQPVDSDEKLKENGIKRKRESDQDSDGSLIFEYVKEDMQLPGQREETQGEGSAESNSFAPPQTVEKCRSHREKESSSETFVCSKCSFKTIRKDKFRYHMNQKHLNKYKCDYCPKRFSSEGHLAKHMEKEHKDEDYSKLPEEDFFRITTKQQGNRKTWYECLECTFKHPGRSDMYRHIRGVHRELLDELYKSKGMVLGDSGYHKCTECFFKTLDTSYLKQHIKTIHQKRRGYVCDLCKKIYSRKSVLVRHMKRIHISHELSKVHKCSICTYKTIDKDHLKRHLNAVHLKIRGFTCDLCQMKISTKSQLQTHIERVHLKKKEIVSCNRDSNCSFRTTNQRELLIHIQRVHEKIQGFSCEICGKWYSSKTGLSYHKKKQQHLTKGPSQTD